MTQTNFGGVTIYPGSFTVVVDMTTVGSGQRLTTYSDATCVTPIVLPQTITTPTTFYVSYPVSALISMMVAGEQVAQADGTKVTWNFQPGVLAGIGIDKTVATVLQLTPSTNATSVVHGADNSVARPLTAQSVVVWVGSVEPLNAVNNDIWVSTA